MSGPALGAPITVQGRGGAGTFSIVAADLEHGFWGAAVSTHPLSVGAVVPWAEWRVGAIATQAQTNYRYGPLGLGLLRKGLSAEEVVRRLTRADREAQTRQLAIVDRRGRAAAWTGSACQASALHVVGDGFSCQANLVAGDEVVHSMVRTFERSRGSLAGRLVSTLKAGERAGSDRRGIQSAAVLVVHWEPWFDATWSDHWVDLRVDQHKHPVRELARILRIDEGLTRKYLRSKDARDRRRRARRS